jgi:hypothetical protein
MYVLYVLCMYFQGLLASDDWSQDLQGNDGRYALLLQDWRLICSRAIESWANSGRER